MQVIEGRHDNRKILLPVTIFRPGNVFDLTAVDVMALLDTGATTSGIGAPIIAELGLISYGKRRLKSAREESFAPYFLFRIGLHGRAQNPHIHQSAVPLPYVFPETDGFSWSHDTDFQVILGMDILHRCNLEVRQNGSWSLSFG